MSSKCVDLSFHKIFDTVALMPNERHNISSDHKSMTSIKKIHTLEARGNVMLEVMREMFSLSPEQMLREIQMLREQMEQTLKDKGVSYDMLRSALVPSQDRKEIALVFDTTKIQGNWYGYSVFERLIPLFDKFSNCSILVGDYLDQSGDQEFLEKSLRSVVKVRNSFTFQHSTQFFIIYINNLTQSQIDNFDEGLAGWKPYVGYADTTYGSAFKYLLSTMLVNLCVKHKGTIIQGHEDDRSDDENINMSSYPFEKSGYRCISLQGMKKDPFLSFKIERPVVDGFEVDTEFSLNSVSPSPLPLDGFAIDVEDAKLTYLRSEKADSLARANLELVDTNRLSNIIKSKVSSSYIYNLSYLDEHGVTKFNIILELPGVNQPIVRLLAALEYQPGMKKLRLLTLY